MTLDQELASYYEDQFAMMATSGWKQFCEDLEAIIVPLKDVQTLTPENLGMRQGRIAELTLILNRRETLSQAYRDLF